MIKKSNKMSIRKYPKDNQTVVKQLSQYSIAVIKVTMVIFHSGNGMIDNVLCRLQEWMVIRNYQ